MTPRKAKNASGEEFDVRYVINVRAMDGINIPYAIQLEMGDDDDIDEMMKQIVLEAKKENVSIEYDIEDLWDENT